MDSEETDGVRSYVLGLCSAIGGMEELVEADGSVGQVYCPGDEALACLRDLKKAIRVDNQNSEKTVLKVLVEYNVIVTDIIPLILSFQKNRNEVSFRFILACVELLVPMTWPVEKSLNVDDEQEEDPNVMHCYRKYKLDLLTEGVFETILAMAMRSLRIPHRDRSVLDHTTIRLSLYLFRNLTAIPDLNTVQSATMEQIRMAHMQEKLMIRYYESDVIEFLMTIASNSKVQSSVAELNLLVLECLYNFVNYIDPKSVYSYLITYGKFNRGLTEKAAVLNDLLSRENEKKRQKNAYAPSRHNRFGGTYILDWDGKMRVTHKQVGGFADPAVLLEGEKKETRSGVKRKLEDKGALRKVYQDGLAFKYLKFTAQSFIKSCFNAFYASILKDMQREDDHIMDKDYIRYYSTLRWFLEYHSYEYTATLKRKENPDYTKSDPKDYDHMDFDLTVVAGTLDLKTVLFCLRFLRSRLDKKEWFDIQMGADCFRQMLLSVGMMVTSTEEEYRNTAEHIQSNVYYEQQHLDLLVEIVTCYKSQSTGYLKTVILLNHVLLKLLDRYQQGKKVLFTRRKPKLSRAKKSKIGEEESLVVAEEESEDEEEKRDRQAAYKDQIFKFSAFEQRYVSTGVIHAYCSLLEGYKDLEPKFIAYITNMFHRIMVKRRAEFLLWKLPVLDLFNRILSDAHRMRQTPELDMLTEFIEYCIYQFFKAAKLYPLLFVEALIPTAKPDRTMWELPDPARVQDEQAYLNDVNYMPVATDTANTTQQRSKSPEDNNIIDEGMADYLFSAFDRKKQEEEANISDHDEEATQSRLSDDDDDIVPMSSISYSDSFNMQIETNTEEVDKLLLSMGIGAN
ncbi:hypothetical protein INT47_001637 [Mucor saturninus]|uniref:Timeless N-terminal domain-containing protein n=1 Tax=Mucor saturninus TaxID=64648 RepID=A0A8H7RMC1_9FUNG|nr:hypothetical protein INT47_001637 [Mucor saturninus]